MGRPDSSDNSPEIGPEEVSRVAALARIHLEPEEIAPLVEHFRKMLRFVEHLEECDEPECPPWRLPPRGLQGWREDVAGSRGEPGGPLEKGQWRENAPESDDGFFTVPRVVG